MDVVVEDVRGLGHHADKLDHLLHGQNGLPPDGDGGSGLAILGVLGGDLGVHGDEVVGVHDGVDQPVQHDGQVDVAVVVDPTVEPVEEEDGGVVVDVEEGELRVEGLLLVKGVVVSGKLSFLAILSHDIVVSVCDAYIF